MRKILINIGERSKQAFAQSINTYKKNKVLSDYLKMIKKNKHLILKENKKDVDWANKIKLRDCLLYTSPSPRDVHLSRMPSSA